MRPRRHVAVIGAGAFGGWTALALAERGVRVTLIDAWGAGNPRSSSGGLTRICRAIYGGSPYTAIAAEALALWRRWRDRSGRAYLEPTGVLWLFAGDDAYARASLPALAACDLPARELSRREAQAAWPQMDLGGVRTVFHEPQGGVLRSRAACRAVERAVAEAGGTVLRALAALGPIAGGRLAAVELGALGRLAADDFVLAAGPWLGQLDPARLGALIRATRQELFTFGLPPGGDGPWPCWIDFADRVRYGLDDGAGGLKGGDDTHGSAFDPTGGDRTPSSAGQQAMRDFLARRFPALAGAPLLRSQVCQYETSPDGGLILDRHPDAENVWIAGGGSGHGFKLGPAVGRRMAAMIVDGARGEAAFSLARFAGRDPRERHSQFAGRAG
jgi:glycine/D-amino acid oxidase-like deaminating enzyme